LRFARSRVRGPYARFCERNDARLIAWRHPTRLSYLQVSYDLAAPLVKAVRKGVAKLQTIGFIGAMC
ncbi:MAG TPA: hypothetical protein PLK04_06650, partial [Bacillota bacterium]|nr:hypothetical protein [Bacillota bacterium]HOO31417.1 hypothetical protein [Bacillota bacterium]HPZ13901.1 hypothetical protein [Bacillota bacterium]